MKPTCVDLSRHDFLVFLWSFDSMNILVVIGLEGSTGSLHFDWAGIVKHRLVLAGYFNSVLISILASPS